MRRARAIAVLMVTFTLCRFGLGADDKTGGRSGEIPKELLGSWEQVVAQVGNQIQKPDAAGNGAVKQLHITATHFTRVTYLTKTKQLLGVGVVAVRSPITSTWRRSTLPTRHRARRQAT